MQAPTSNKISQTQHGPFRAVDYSAKPDPIIYAPERGKITNYGPSGTCGNRLELTARANRHGFCHLEKSLVKVGDIVQRGQPIGVMGYTGKTKPVGPKGKHLHHVILVSSAIYVYPPSLVNEPFVKIGTGGNVDNTKPTTHYRANQLAHAVLMRGMTLEEFNKFHKGQTELQLFETFRKSKEHADKEKKLNSMPPTAKVLTKGIYEVR